MTATTSDIVPIGAIIPTNKNKNQNPDKKTDKNKIQTKLNFSNKITPTNKVEPVKIKPHQVPHFKRLIHILTREYGYLDVSTFGSGKTHVTFGVAATFKLSIIVITTKGTINNWKKYATQYGINLIDVMSYQTLRGQNTQVKHSLLETINEEYVATDFFTKCVMKGILLVFDEYHNLKNDNSQLASAHALVKELVRLVRMGYKSRIALLSGTPCTEKENVSSTFKMLGIIISDKLYNYNRSCKTYELIGIQEAINKCNIYDKDETLNITCRPINKTTINIICYELYTRVLKRFIVSSMPPPPIESNKLCFNYYILMPDTDINRLKNGICLFKTATNYNLENNQISYSKINWGDVTTSRMEIDSAKIPSVCRLAIKQLTDDPNSKVLIYCNYKRDIETAMKLMYKYNPLMMNGSTDKEKRTEIINKFQRDDNDYRVIISNCKVGGIGIDLDDKYGNRPRYMYILPSYFFTDQYQATGRIHRIGTKSNATVYFIYSRDFPYETGILNSMAIKSEVVKNMVTKEQKDIKYPGDYDELYESYDWEK